MKTKAKINLQLLKTTTFDSGALGMLAMVIHQFGLVGRYHVSIRNQGQAVGDIDFEVDNESEVTQLDIDLAHFARKRKARIEENSRNKQTAPVVSPKGYVLFHASSGFGYSAIVSDEETKVVFDSTKLNINDLFVVSLLEPDNYLVANTIFDCRAQIVLSPRRDSRSLETVYVDAGEKEFDPKRIELISTQGLVFRIKGMARIVIKKESPPQIAPGPKPMISWRNLRQTNTAASSGSSSA